MRIVALAGLSCSVLSVITFLGDCGHDRFVLEEKKRECTREEPKAPDLSALSFRIVILTLLFVVSLSPVGAALPCMDIRPLYAC